MNVQDNQFVQYFFMFYANYNCIYVTDKFDWQGILKCCWICSTKVLNLQVKGY